MQNSNQARSVLESKRYVLPSPDNLSHCGWHDQKVSDLPQGLLQTERLVRLCGRGKGLIREEPGSEWDIVTANCYPVLISPIGGFDTAGEGEVFCGKCPGCAVPCRSQTGHRTPESRGSRYLHRLDLIRVGRNAAALQPVDQGSPLQ